MRSSNHTMPCLDVPITLHNRKRRERREAQYRAAAFAMVPSDVEFVHEIPGLVILRGNDPFIRVAYETNVPSSPVPFRVYFRS